MSGVKASTRVRWNSHISKTLYKEMEKLTLVDRTFHLHIYYTKQGHLYWQTNNKLCQENPIVNTGKKISFL